MPLQAPLFVITLQSFIVPSFGQCHGNGLSKVTYAGSANASFRALDWMIKVLNMTPAQDSSVGNVQQCESGTSGMTEDWLITMQRGETVVPGDYAVGTCDLELIERERGVVASPTTSFHSETSGTLSSPSWKSSEVGSAAVFMTPPPHPGADCSYFSSKIAKDPTTTEVNGGGGGGDDDTSSAAAVQAGQRIPPQQPPPPPPPSASSSFRGAVVRVKAHNPDTCCKSCVASSSSPSSSSTTLSTKATKECTGATYNPPPSPYPTSQTSGSSPSAADVLLRGGQKHFLSPHAGPGPQPGECFGLHVTSVPGHRTTPTALATGTADESGSSRIAVPATSAGAAVVAPSASTSNSNGDVFDAMVDQKETTPKAAAAASAASAAKVSPPPPSSFFSSSFSSLSFSSSPPPPSSPTNDKEEEEEEEGFKRSSSSSMSVADVERAFSIKLGSMGHFDPFLDYNAALFTVDLDEYLERLDAYGSKWLAGVWEVPVDSSYSSSSSNGNNDGGSVNGNNDDGSVNGKNNATKKKRGYSVFAHVGGPSQLVVEVVGFASQRINHLEEANLEETSLKKGAAAVVVVALEPRMTSERAKATWPLFAGAQKQRRRRQLERVQQKPQRQQQTQTQPLQKKPEQPPQPPPSEVESSASLFGVTVVGVSRAVSSVSLLKAVEEFYVSGVGASVTLTVDALPLPPPLSPLAAPQPPPPPSVDAAAAAEAAAVAAAVAAAASSTVFGSCVWKRCFQWPGSAADACYTTRLSPLASFNKSFTVGAPLSATAAVTNCNDVLRQHEGADRDGDKSSDSDGKHTNKNSLIFRDADDGYGSASTSTPTPPPSTATSTASSTPSSPSPPSSPSSFSVRDFEALLTSSHERWLKVRATQDGDDEEDDQDGGGGSSAYGPESSGSVLGGGPACAMDRWADNHYAVDLGSYDPAPLLAFVLARGLSYTCGGGPNGDLEKGAHYVFDPVGWGIQLDMDMGKQRTMPGCKEAASAASSASVGESAAHPGPSSWCLQGSCPLPVRRQRHRRHRHPPGSPAGSPAGSPSPESPVQDQDANQPKTAGDTAAGQSSSSSHSFEDNWSGVDKGDNILSSASAMSTMTTPALNPVPVFVAVAAALALLVGLAQWVQSTRMDSNNDGHQDKRRQQQKKKKDPKRGGGAQGEYELVGRPQTTGKCTNGGGEKGARGLLLTPSFGKSRAPIRVVCANTDDGDCCGSEGGEDDDESGCNSDADHDDLDDEAQK